jgi:hypothetical protein
VQIVLNFFMNVILIVSFVPKGMDFAIFSDALLAVSMLCICPASCIIFARRENTLRSASGRDSAGGMATRYGRDGPGIKSLWG